MNYLRYYHTFETLHTITKKLVAYHRTNSVFGSFDNSKQNSGWLSKGIYFSTEQDEYEHFGDIVMMCELTIIKPFIIESDIVKPDGSVDFAPSIKEQIWNRCPETKKIHFSMVSNYLESKGYDSIIYGDMVNVFNSKNVYIINREDL